MIEDQAYKIGAAITVLLSEETEKGNIDSNDAIKFILKKSADFLRSIKHEPNFNALRKSFANGMKDAGLKVLENISNSMDHQHNVSALVGCFACNDFHLVEDSDSVIAILTKLNDEDGSYDTRLLVYPPPLGFHDALYSIDSIANITMRDIEDLTEDQIDYLKQIISITYDFLNKKED